MVSVVNLHVDSKTGWGSPNQIETRTPPVQALPSEFMPEPFRAWLDDVSHRMQTPPDFAAISAIVMTGSIIGAGCGIYPKRHDYGFSVIPNLWGHVSGGLRLFLNRLQ